VPGANEKSGLFQRAEHGDAEAHVEGPQPGGLGDRERQAWHFQELGSYSLDGTREGFEAVIWVIWGLPGVVRDVTHGHSVEIGCRSAQCRVIIPTRCDRSLKAGKQGSNNPARILRSMAECAIH
jgi:hypothetical protein